MSQPCVVNKCNRISRGLCDCCTQHLCLQHLSEHNASLISQLNPLSHEINALGDRFKTLNIQEVVDGCRQKLEEWRWDCHQKIDYLFEQKCQELDRSIDHSVKKQHEEIVRIKSKVAELIGEQETTRQDIDSIMSAIHHLNEQMDRIKNTCFRITTRPLVMDDSFIHIKEVNELDLSTLPPIYKDISRPDESRMAINSSDRFLLMHRKPNLCLVDREMNIVKEVLWTHDNILDTCWSATLNRFIVIDRSIVYLVDENTMWIDTVQAIEERSWQSCTCSKTFLFLLVNELVSPILKFRLLPSLELVKEWSYPNTCAQNECINDILYNNGTLSVIIRNMWENSLRIELRSSGTLDCIWSLRFDTVCNQNIGFRCCLLTGDEWLVVDYETKRLLQITKDGKLKATIPYDGNPRRANLFGNMLVISTKYGVNAHKL